MRSRPVGEHALLVHVEDPRQAATVRRLVLELAARATPAGLAAPLDVVPAEQTVLVDGLPGLAAVAAWQDRLSGESLPTAEGDHDGLAGPCGRLRTIDVRYDGPDLVVVAHAWRCSPAAVVDRHTAATFQVAFCGFAPGFAYCLATPPLPEVPRRSEPRPRVPAGSVAMGGPYCGVYPADLPGGWQLVGVTSARLFDPAGGEPALLAPGDVVRFQVGS